MPLRQLPEAACPLLARLPHFRERFNAVVADLDEIERDDPEFYQRKDLRALVREAEELQTLLERPRYEVGLIGLFQVGKSSTLNRILRADLDSRPAFEGQAGKATTATVTRVHAQTAGRGHALTLRYLDRGGYARKRDGLVEALARKAGLEFSGDEGELLRRIAGLLDEARRQKDRFLELNLGYLQRLLEAHRADRNNGYRYLREEGAVPLEVGGIPYEQRWEYINHAADRPGHISAPLLRDVRIAYRTEVVPAEVELIDLPGLGTGWAIDTILTEEVMGTLNGALLFYQVTSNMDNEQLGEVLLQLRKLFPDGLQGRVWIVFTFCDALGKNHFLSPSHNIFTGITSFLGSDLSPEQICFVCNKWDGKSQEELEAQLLEMTGTADLKAMFPAHTQLIESFTALRHNGGIDRLRDLLTGPLKDEVERELAREVERRLSLLTDELRTAKQLRKLETTFDPRRQEQLNAVLRRVRQVRGHVERRRELLEPDESLRDYFGPPVKRLHEQLQASFDSVYADGAWLRGETIAQVARVFPGHARRLEQHLHHALATELVLEVYREVGKEFDGLPSPPVAYCPQGVRARWDQLASADRGDASWRRHWKMPTFLSDRLFGDGKGRHADGTLAALDGISYRALMLEKIQVVAQQAGHALRMRVREHLDRIEQAYRDAAETLEQHAPPSLANP